jgi:hypothetical protein
LYPSNLIMSTFLISTSEVDMKPCIAFQAFKDNFLQRWSPLRAVLRSQR